MGKVRIEGEIAANATRVWDLVRDFGGIDRWNPGLDSCETDREGVGSVRTIKMGNATIRERLEKLDEAGKSLSYSILEAPVPVQNYLATIDVAEAGPGATKVVWSSTFDSAGMPEEQLAQIFEGVYRQGIDGLRKASE